MKTALTHSPVTQHSTHGIALFHTVITGIRPGIDDMSVICTALRNHNRIVFEEMSS